MARSYVNAADVLPPELLTQVMEVLGNQACIMWVPAAKNANRRNRSAYVVRLYDEGLSATDIAVRLFISERTVWRILAKERAQRAPSARGPGQGLSNPHIS